MTGDETTTWLGLAVAGLGLCLVLAILVTPPTPGPVGAHRDVAATMHTWIDEERALHDLPPLAPAEDIARVAERWSARMAEMRSMEHNPTFGDELCCWEFATENVAYGEAYAVRLPGDAIERVTRELHEGLLASPGHRKNLLDPTVDQLGIGVHVDPEGTVWITQNFRRHRSASN